MAAVQNNTFRVSGIAPKAKYIPAKFLGPTAAGTQAGAIAAIDYLTDLKRRHGLKSSPPTTPRRATSADAEALQAAIQRGADAGILFVTIAGNGDQNGGYDIDQTPNYPASLSCRLPSGTDCMIVVTAIDRNGDRPDSPTGASTPSTSELQESRSGFLGTTSSPTGARRGRATGRRSPRAVPLGISMGDRHRSASGPAQVDRAHRVDEGHHPQRRTTRRPGHAPQNEPHDRSPRTRRRSLVRQSRSGGDIGGRDSSGCVKGRYGSWRTPADLAYPEKPTTGNTGGAEALLRAVPSARAERKVAGRPSKQIGAPANQNSSRGDTASKAKLAEVARQVIIQWDPKATASARQNALAEVGVVTRTKLNANTSGDVPPVDVATVQKGRDAALAKLDADPAVLSVEPNRMLRHAKDGTKDY